MFESFKLNRIIKRSIDKTVAMIGKGYPEIIFYTFYGSFKTDPHSLVIWYVFKTDSDLSGAEKAGYSKGIEELTVRNLISFGYPEEAFESDGEGKKVTVCFASQEDVDRKADGDYRIYFQ